MKKNIIYAVIIVCALAATYFLFNSNNRNQKNNLASLDELAETQMDSMKIHLTAPKTMFGVNIDSFEVYEGNVERNENLASILSQFNITAQTIAEISQLPRNIFDVRKIQTSKPFTVIYDKDTLKTARYFVYQPNPIDYVRIELGDSVVANQGKNKVDTILTSLSGTIEYSLYQSLVDSGASPLLVNELADVYAWEIDFFGLQKGDSYKVFYEKYEVKGEPAGIGHIKAAYFNHMGEDFYAVAYDQGQGEEYFDEEGSSLRKTFLKAPLKYSRISSHFTHSRFHPVLKIRRPHLGVDYAAPTGTPVMAVGDGLVTKAAYSGGAGNLVKIKHNSNYETAYMHLSRYGKGIRPGVRVKQGDIIGYVGATGLATGPHLDFRFYKNGRAVDPLKIDPPSADPIKDEEREKYNAVKDIWVHKLDSLSTPQQNLAI